LDFQTRSFLDMSEEFDPFTDAPAASPAEPDFEFEEDAFSSSNGQSDYQPAEFLPSEQQEPLEEDQFAQDDTAAPLASSSPSSSAPASSLPVQFDDFGYDEQQPSLEPSLDLDANNFNQYEQKDQDSDTPYSKWQQERQSELAARDQKAKAEKSRIQQEGKEAVAKFHAERQEKIRKLQATNRADEVAWRKDMEQAGQGGNVWEKVGKMVNLKSSDASPNANANPANAKQPVQQRKDRMRSLLLQLKSGKDQRNL